MTCCLFPDCTLAPVPLRCDPEWGGEYCDEPAGPLPSQLKDSFSRAPSLSHWHTLTGAKLSTVCGAVASGAALHFSGVSKCCSSCFFFYCNSFSINVGFSDG